MKLLTVALVAAGLLALVATGAAGGKKGEPKAEANGKLTMGDNTYKLTNALAYETKRSNRKETVVILSAKPLDTAKLKQSLKKHGTDEDFFPFDAHVKLRFDEQGTLSQTAIYADGANIIGSGDDNIKATATIKDGTAKGKAGMVKPGEFFKKSYQFEVTFDVAIIQATPASAEPKTVTEPKTTPKTKTTPIQPGQPLVASDKELRIEGKLAKDSPEIMGKPAQVHQVKMSSDKTYVIDLESSDFDAYLRVLDASGKQLASDDDGGKGFNARLRFQPPSEGTYQIVATIYDSGEGNYLLKIRPLKSKATAKTNTPPGQPLLTDKLVQFDGKLANDSPEVMGKPSQIHKVKMSPDKTYIIDLESSDFDAYLRILNSAGKELARDDDSGGNHNARIRFTPSKEGEYQIVATRFGFGQGNYVLRIGVLRAVEEKQR
jgi:hypothetical protein